ncbi:MAG: metallophosphoesterase [Gemmatimonadota bacterium]|nr:metallophosphoesterase [Gemmatimonadota bacterium]
MRHLRIGILPLLLGAGLFVSPVGTRPASTRAALPPPADSLNDGPHVYWQDSTHAIVFYLCGGAFPADRVRAQDTLAFAGRCTDSTAQYRLPRRPPRPARDTWDGVPRILALSDIHGEYDALVAFLERAGVIDTAGRWSWGNGHLVVLGDVVDRGDRVTECLWFLYRLEQEAERAGGRVHLTLGNHEMMVMRDDLRYVHAKYTSGIVRYTGIRYPDLFGPDMELGRWLRSKPFVLKLNDVVFVHGGLAPELAGRGLDIPTLNAIGRGSLDLSSVALAFSDVPSMLLGSAGPLWYRGYVGAREGRYPAATSEELDAMLRFYGATTMVVGHTDLPQVTALHEGRVIVIDVSLETLGAFQGLLWEDGAFSVVTGVGTVEPLPRP